MSGEDRRDNRGAFGRKLRSELSVQIDFGFPVAAWTRESWSDRTMLQLQLYTDSVLQSILLVCGY